MSHQKNKLQSLYIYIYIKLHLFFNFLLCASHVDLELIASGTEYQHILRTRSSWLMAQMSRSHEGAICPWPYTFDKLDPGIYRGLVGEFPAVNWSPGGEPRRTLGIQVFSPGKLKERELPGAMLAGEEVKWFGRLVKKLGPEGKKREPWLVWHQVLDSGGTLGYLERGLHKGRCVSTKKGEEPKMGGNIGGNVATGESVKVKGRNAERNHKKKRGPKK